MRKRDVPPYRSMPCARAEIVHETGIWRRFDRRVLTILSQSNGRPVYGGDMPCVAHRFSHGSERPTSRTIMSKSLSFRKRSDSQWGFLLRRSNLLCCASFISVIFALFFSVHRTMIDDLYTDRQKCLFTELGRSDFILQLRKYSMHRIR